MTEHLMEHSNCGIGIVANINNNPEHVIVKEGIQVLNRLEHRGGVLHDGSGDGCGILTQIPRELFEKELGIESKYYLAMTFLPKDRGSRDRCIAIIEEELEKKDVKLIAQRKVPVKKESLGVSAAMSLPRIEQLFIEDKLSGLEMYILRRTIEKRIYGDEGFLKKEFYFTSFSNSTVVYKGLITPEQFNDFYLDLLNENFKSSYVMVHQRFSTNTLPSWNLAQPFRMLEHNGEINTIEGNKGWTEARRGDIYSDLVPKKLVEQSFPLTCNQSSDSANLDSLVEFMSHNGMSLPKILTTLVPQAWEKDETLEKSLRDYYETKALAMEPWDGPAGLVASNGNEIFATLDRNGLRPMRYTLTDDNKLIVSSEMGVLDTEFSKIVESGKLSAGEFLYLNLDEKKLYTRDEVIAEITNDTNYEEEMKGVKDLAPAEVEEKLSLEKLEEELARFTYTKEDVNQLIDYICENGKEKVASHTYDAPLAVLDEENPRLLFDYFKQKFAQVTNPPIDSIREKTIFSLTTYFGSKRNLLDIKEKRGNIKRFESPIITNSQLEKLKEVSEVLSTGFEGDMKEAMDDIVENAILLAKKGKNILLSDKNTKKSVPMLLIVGVVHNSLVKAGLRTRVGLGVKTGEAREVTHYAMLIGYGADVVNPYAVLDYITHFEKDMNLYFRGINSGIEKVISKMGISSLASYRGARIFESIGIAKDVLKDMGENGPSQIGGISYEEIEMEVELRANKGYSYKTTIGEYTEIKNGMHHRDSFKNVKILQEAIREKNYSKYKEYSINLRQDEGTLRNNYRLSGRRIGLSDIESRESIIKRFVEGAMSFGSLSKEAHETIAIAFNRLGIRSNSGEGGEDPSRFLDNRISEIKQISSGRFGVTNNYLMNAKEIQIKMAQGAKPGEGGHLPAAKVNKEIGSVRNTIEGIDLISPPPHHDIYSIEDLAQLIYDLRNLNTTADISIKLASEKGVGIIAGGTVKAGADTVIISGGDGGTGAAMASSQKYAATSWELGISETHKSLCENNLRHMVKLVADGSIRNGFDIVVATLLGADGVSLGTGILNAIGCISCKKCNLNVCPVGITTQKEALRKRFKGTPEGIVTYLEFLADDVREILAWIGVRSLEEIIGKSSLISFTPHSGYKKKTVDISGVIREVLNVKNPITLPREVNSLNEALRSSYKGRKTRYEGTISNIDRSIGTTSGGLLELDAFRSGNRKTQEIILKGYAGQSLGAFLAKGQSIMLEGFGNDYVGKGLSGGKIVIKKPSESKFELGCVAGNTCMYGATSGEVYLNGYAGERFAVRNSGSDIVVEGIGNHGCEYMTGGSVIILGQSGKNFGAGMSGGIAYLLKESVKQENLNTDIAEICDMNSKDVEFIKAQLEKHIEYTGSAIAKRVLGEDIEGNFVKISSKKYLIVTGNIDGDLEEKKTSYTSNEESEGLAI